MHKHSNVARALLVFSTSIMQRAAIVFLTIMAARSLTPEEFGVFSYAYISIVSLSSFAGEALAVSVYKFYNPLQENLKLGISNIYSIVVVAILSSFVGAIGVGTLVAITVSHGLTAIVLISSGMSFALILSPSLYALLNKIDRLKTASTVNFLGGILVICLAAIVKLNPDVNGYLASAACGLMFTLFMNTFILWKQNIFRYIPIRSINFNKTQIKFSLTTGLTMCLGGPVHWLCVYMLSISTNGIKEVANFTAFFQWYLVITFVPSALSGFIVPWLAEHARQSRNTVFVLMAWRTVKMAVIFGVSIIFIGIILGDVAVGLYGKNYLHAKSTFLLSISAAAIASVMAIINQIYFAGGKALDSLKYSAIYSAFYVAGSAIFILNFNLGANALYTSILLALLVQISAQIFSRGFAFGER